MITDVTKTWKHQRTTEPGLHVVLGRETAGQKRPVVRIGADGIRGGANGLSQRLNDLLTPWTPAKTTATHECTFTDVECAWEITGWTRDQMKMGKALLRDAVARRLILKTDGLPNKTVFLNPEKIDFAAVLGEVLSELKEIDAAVATA